MRVLILLINLFFVRISSSFDITSKVYSRKVISSITVSVSILLNPLVATAGMLTVPLKSPLHNNVWLVRAGTSYADERDEIQTNPVKKLRMDNGLTSKGQEEARNAAKKLIDLGITPTFIWTSNTERAYETAKVMAQELQLGQNRIVPEYSFLDARAMGTFEGTTPIKVAYDKIHEEDAKNIKYRPDANNDGTPSESVDDVYVRGNQLIATIESMYSGENVIIVSPDSDNLSILSAAVADEHPDQSLPLHARFQFTNGEVRKLDPIIIPSKLLVTGQTVEEAEENNLRMMVAKIKGNYINSINLIIIIINYE